MRLLHFHFKNHNRPLEGTGSKRDLCPASSLSTGAEFPVVPVESALMRTDDDARTALLRCLDTLWNYYYYYYYYYTVYIAR